ncbi:MAG: FAD:protein FMN transferase [Desulfobacterota bacterium]|nr:FAD:protein FMN transferase [Thermodesulfobacteriota bacterium]
MPTWFFTFFCLSVLLMPHTCKGAGDNASAIVSQMRPLLHTFVEIKAWGDGAHEAIEAAFAEMSRINDLLNNYDPASEVSRINAAAGEKPVTISPETMDALRTAIRFCELSGGAFDITVGPLLKFWGFAQEEPGMFGHEPDRRAIRKAKKLVDYRAIELTEVQKEGGAFTYCARLKRPGMWIDVGAFSKGYVADRAMEVLGARGITNMLISAGGTICARGKKPDGSPWMVAVRHPRKEDSFLTFVKLSDASISTSGDYERFYEHEGKRRGHIIDPRSGMPVERMQSVSVIARSGVESDALSTALFVLGPEKGIALIEKLPDASALLITQQGEIVMSRKWPQRTVFY